ncbi:MAG: nucleoside triphosphate hydrolase [Rhodobacterales bacterium]|nr:MAG: nucleoside triphosphate hydrolase [Rhodobacterales bacterium]
MRPSKSRSRNNKNRNRQPGGNNQNRVFDSSGPEGKVRGTPQQIIDKYNQLARDAVLANDRVAVENFQQHAEHYTRILAEAQREAEAKREQQEELNRERQQKREAERLERQQRAERQQEQQKTVPMDPASAPQPGMDADPVAEATDHGLVDTPESKPAPRKRVRKPRVKKEPQAKPAAEQPAAQAEPSPQPEADTA